MCNISERFSTKAFLNHSNFQFCPSFNETRAPQQLRSQLRKCVNSKGHAWWWAALSWNHQWKNQGIPQVFAETCFVWYL